LGGGAAKPFCLLCWDMNAGHFEPQRRCQPRRCRGAPPLLLPLLLLVVMVGGCLHAWRLCWQCHSHCKGVLVCARSLCAPAACTACRGSCCLAACAQLLRPTQPPCRAPCSFVLLESPSSRCGGPSVLPAAALLRAVPPTKGAAVGVLICALLAACSAGALKPLRGCCRRRCTGSAAEGASGGE
jgi:hypothetical protein